MKKLFFYSKCKVKTINLTKDYCKLNVNVIFYIEPVVAEREFNRSGSYFPWFDTFCIKYSLQLPTLMLL
jgi:hypothetical protein